MISTELPRISSSRLSPNTTSPKPPTLATGAHSDAIWMIYMPVLSLNASKFLHPCHARLGSGLPLHSTGDRTCDARTPFLRAAPHPRTKPGNQVMPARDVTLEAIGHIADCQQPGSA